jgi:hypothetical protein
LVAVLVFALLRFSVAARDARGRGAGEDKLSAALQEAVTRLQAQETSHRRARGGLRAPERRNHLGSQRRAARRWTGRRDPHPQPRRAPDAESDEAAPPDVCRRALDELALLAVIDECLSTQAAVVRRSVTLPEARHGVSHVGITVSPLFDNAQLHGAICLFTDLTAVKDLEEQLG